MGTVSPIEARKVVRISGQRRIGVRGLVDVLISLLRVNAGAKMCEVDLNMDEA